MLEYGWNVGIRLGYWNMVRMPVTSLEGPTSNKCGVPSKDVEKRGWYVPSGAHLVRCGDDKHFEGSHLSDCSCRSRCAELLGL
jgi:hypothetical protein